MWVEIRRRVLTEGESKREILREYGIHYKTLQKILTYAEPPGYRKREPGPAKKIAPYLGVIRQILEDDRSAPPKQRHTAKRIWERLRAEHGFDGGQTIVKDAVRAWKMGGLEVFVPLVHRPGEGQVDFGAAVVVMRGERIVVAVFEVSLPYSGAVFCVAYPAECTETFQDGHVRAFEFFGGVMRWMVYDNPRIAVVKAGPGRKRVLSSGFLRLQSHYLFTERFCGVRKPHEKGSVESLVGYGRRNFMVPVPHVESFEELNAMLREGSRDDLSRRVRGKDKTKGELLEEERRSFLPLPKTRFEAHRVEETKANSLSLVRFHCNDYSVPTACAHHPVIAVGTVDEVRLIAQDQVVARHRRCWKKERAIFDPLHYLALLERKARALDQARPLEGWDLPPCFALLRRRLEAQDEKGTREYIKVLRLLESIPLAVLTGAVEHGLSIGAIQSEAVRLIALHRQERPVTLFCLDGHPHLKAVILGPIALTAYRDLVPPPAEG
jgi:transposase